MFFWLCLLVGISIRVWTATFGHNYDLESYWIVSEVVLNGKSVYAETPRYNYGPIWFLLLGIFRWLAVTFNINDLPSLHMIIAGFLSLVDSLIALVLRNKYGTKISLLFFLNPVSILITGYHSQFDNFAILIGLIASSDLIIDNNRNNFKKHVLSCALLGLSLTLKHVFLFFPLWIWWANKSNSFAKRGLVLLVPYGIFILSFLPFIFDPRSGAGIIENVIKYKSLYGNALLSQLLGLFICIKNFESYFNISVARVIFVLLAIASGYFWVSKHSYKKNGSEVLIIYLITLVVFTSSMADQYLAIPIIAVALYHNHIAAWIYSLVATVVITSSPNNIFSERISDPRFFDYPQAQVWLFILLIVLWRQPCSEALSYNENER